MDANGFAYLKPSQAISKDLGEVAHSGKEISAFQV